MKLVRQLFYKRHEIKHYIRTNPAVRGISLFNIHPKNPAHVNYNKNNNE
jgi:hypothetical protein